MRRVLVLAYYFPPLGGAGVQRTVKLLKHLPAFGYEAGIVTGPEDAGVEWAPRDDTLARDVPLGTRVVRVDENQPPWRSRWRGRVDRWLDRPTPFARWWVEGAVAAAGRLPEVDVVYASMSPFETASAARVISSERGVPWVADLRDPWALDEWSVYPSVVHRRLDERRMGDALADAGAIIMNTQEAERVARQRFPQLAERLTVVPNGWDEADFEPPMSHSTDGPFRIVYTGFSHVTWGWSHRRLRLVREALGGATRGLDVLSRSHAFLLEAIDRLVLEEPQLAARIEVHLAGAARSTGLQRSYVRDHGYLPHPDALALVRSADLLFLPMHDLPSGFRARTVPGKTYEYLASGRPILAALPDGDARDLLTGLEHARVCRPRDVACLAAAIQAFVSSPPATRQPAVALRFERRTLAERFVSVFDGLLSVERAAVFS